jgi:hypothetical protein
LRAASRASWRSLAGRRYPRRTWKTSLYPYADAREQGGGELLQAVLSTPPAIDPATAPRTPEDLRREAPATLRQAVGILERHATEDEVVAYKRFVFSLADTVARAHREGGFLGLGGTEISEHEQEALDEIAAIFDEPQNA